MAPAQPSKEMLQDLFALAERLAAAQQGDKGVLIEGFSMQYDVSRAEAYRLLRRHADFAPVRKTRSDCGSTRLPDDSLQFIAASVNLSVRNNGVSTKPIGVAMNIAEQNGFEINVSRSRVAALMRAQRLDVKTQANARNHQRLRSLHPNHVHEIDPSLCLVYYLGGRQYIMNEEQFNKNKPVAMERVKLKVLRYVRYDHASRVLDVRYFEAAGEDQVCMFEFLLYTWSKQEHRLSHGVPKMLLWDKGSANTSAGIKRLLDALGVNHVTHATHHAWAKGGVESANWIVERQFESRLRDEPVNTVEQLNASASAWVRDYNANAIRHVECRVLADDGQRYVRDDLWNLIAHHPGALVAMPERDVCAYFMRGKEETRVIRDGHITFVHPQTRKSELYNLQAWARDFANGDKVKVSPMLLGDAVLRIELERYGAEALVVELTPEREFDAYGRPLSAPLLGHEYKSAPHNAAQEAAKTLAQATYGADTSLDDAEAKRSKNVRPFQHLNDGQGVVAHSHLGQTELPTRLLPPEHEVKTLDMQTERVRRAVRILSQFDAAQWLVARGFAMTAELVATLRSLYPDGVPEPELEALQARLTVRGGLRVVAGGGL